MYTYQNLLENHSDLLDTIDTPSLIHGDLWPRNVLFQKEGNDVNLAAVIDGERAFWGDPISDWVLLFYDLPVTFWQGYGEDLLASTNPTLLALYRGMYYVLNILESERFPEDIEPYRENLREVNKILTDS